MTLQFSINQIGHTFRYPILISIIITLGVVTTVPLASANTFQIAIIPSSGASNYCSATDTCYSPSILNVSPGDTVTWINTDNVGHTVTSGLPYGLQIGVDFDSGMIPSTKTYSFTFQNPGTYKYFCKIDRWMVGEIIVGPYTKSSQTPEFGPLVELVILISIIGVIVITKRMKLI